MITFKTPRPSLHRHAIFGLAMGLAIGLPLSLHAYPLLNLTTNVQPLNGTANDGDTFPGAVLPFGMVQWSPDTTSLDHSGGYYYPEKQIVGFSLDHLSGAGCGYGGDFAFTPIPSPVTNSPANSGNGGRTAFAATFTHQDEIATPGYYSVRFTNGIRTELTATLRSGFGRFTYPAGSGASLVINAGSGATGTRNASIDIHPDGREISGWTTQNGFCGSRQAVTVYFDAVFDQPFATYGVWNGGTLVPNGTNAIGTETGVYLSFNPPASNTVLARTAISYVSVANARQNLQTENPADAFTSAGFDALAGAASNVWNGYLNKFQVTGGTDADRQTFYTMMYHALQAPSVVSDVNGQYIGFDNSIRTATNFTKYEFFSGWDIYRSECQFIALVDPARASDMAQSLIQDAHEGGAMPRWSVPSGDTGVMMGDPATPIIAGIYAFGGTNFDTAAGLAAMVKAAKDPSVVAANGVHERDAERDLLNLGYIPAAERGGYGPVSMTLEYGSADFALSRFAQSLGDPTNSLQALQRAQSWRNHFNADSGYLQQRDADSRWSPGFPAYEGRAYVEGSADQYFWMVPFNLRSLAGLIGGPEATCARLDRFFTQLNDGNGNSRYAYMGNEPCSEVPWIYSFLGKPYRTSALVRQCMTQLFSTAPTGLPGNDDLGQMASWYVFSALGLYPEIPGDNVLILNGPLFPQAVLHLAGGDVTITGGQGDDAPYVQSLTLNGKAVNAPWLRLPEIAGGATLAFTMGATANTNWGSDPDLAPPSYSDGMTAPLAQTYVWGTGLEDNDIPLSATNTVDNDPPGGGLSNVDPIIGNGPNGPELVVRTENSQSGSHAIMYSGKATGGTTDFAYLKAFDLTGKNLTVTPGMHLSYWIFPQSPKAQALAAGNNSAFVAVDLVFSDDSTLRDSDVTDQHGTRLHPAEQGHQLAVDTWNYVTADLTSLAGKTISRVDLGFDDPAATGGFRGYVDDIAITTPAELFGHNLALNQPATADSLQAGSTPNNADDGNAGTAWTAGDNSVDHWWQVDLGAICNLNGDEILWPASGQVYDYKVETSLDGASWTLVSSKAANPSLAQDQSDVFAGPARYLRITITGLPAGQPASFLEVRVFGSKVVLPPAPASLQAFGGYGLVGLTWAPSIGATAYQVKRASSSGAETTIATVGGTNYIDTGLTAGTSYYYVVSAANILGESGNSGEASATSTAPTSGTPYETALLAAHPIAYWPLAETSGTVAFDPVGGNIGLYVGGVTLGQSGVALPGFGTSSRAAVFDGKSGYVDIATDRLNLTNALTIITWVKLPAMPAHFSGIFGHGDSAWRTSVSPSGQPGAADGASDDATATGAIADNNWHMIAYTYTGTPDAKDNGTLYVDGVVAAHDTVTTMTGGDSDVFIGGAPDYGTDRLLAGSLAQAAVFANALSIEQVAALYKAAAQ